MQIPSLETSQWIWLFTCATLIGMSKSGLKGTGMVVVPILATLFGGKYSAGLLLPMLSMADVFAVKFYNRHAEWKYLYKLLPSAIVGVCIGLWIGDQVDDQTFKILIGSFIIGGLVVMLWLERVKTDELAKGWWFSALFGILGGISTMIGNAAGPIMATYLLSTKIPKNSYIGTGAWFFLIINLFKTPLHVLVWETITFESFSLNLMVLPAIAIGAFLGFNLVKMIPEKWFRYFVILMTFITSLKLLFS